MRRRFLLIHNPVAGLRGRTLSQRVARKLKRHGCEVVIMRQLGLPTGAAAEGMLSHAALETFDAVIAAGGDGTVRALLSRLAGTGVPLGIIPAGTGNVLAREVGMPTAPQGIADVLYAGPETKLTGATANGEPFLLMAGAGFDGQVIGALDLETKRSFGKIAYSMPITRALMQSPPMFDVEVDGTHHTATWVVVARARHYAGGFKLVPDANLWSRTLHAVLFSAQSRAGRMRELAYLASGKLAACPSVVILPAQEVTVQAREDAMSLHPAHAAQLDGDPFGHAPLHVRADGLGAVPLIVPDTFVKQRPPDTDPPSGHDG